MSEAGLVDLQLYGLSNTLDVILVVGIVIAAVGLCIFNRS